MATKDLHVRVEEGIYEEVSKAAEQEFRPLSSLVNMILKDWLKAQKPAAERTEAPR